MSLRGQLEKGEAVRQNLEFELMRVQKDREQNQKNGAEKEATLNGTIQNLRSKLYSGIMNLNSISMVI